MAYRRENYLGGTWALLSFNNSTMTSTMMRSIGIFNKNWFTNESFVKFFRSCSSQKDKPRSSVTFFSTCRLKSKVFDMKKVEAKRKLVIKKFIEKLLPVTFKQLSFNIANDTRISIKYTLTSSFDRLCIVAHQNNVNTIFKQWNDMMLVATVQQFIKLIHKINQCYNMCVSLLCVSMNAFCLWNSLII